MSSRWVALDGEAVPQGLLRQLDGLEAEAGLDKVGFAAPVPPEQADPDAAGPWSGPAPMMRKALVVFLEHYDAIMAQFTPTATPGNVAAWITTRTGYTPSQILESYSRKLSPQHKAKLMSLDRAMKLLRTMSVHDRTELHNNTPPRPLKRDNRRAHPLWRWRSHPVDGD